MIVQPSHVLLGMGNRRKLLYHDQCLRDVQTGEVVREWREVYEVLYEPEEYRLTLRTPRGDELLAEDERSLWTERGGVREHLSEAPLSLPRFGAHPHAPLLRRLHLELLLCIVDGRPLPHPTAYSQPWRRDAAMMMLVLWRTGNASLVSEWIASLRDPYDRNNGGTEEPDNLGQTLALIALAGQSGHPAISLVLDAAARVTEDGPLVGLTDGAPHPVYQTLWMKLGLRLLELDDPFRVPVLEDSYARLFWMDRSHDAPLVGRFDAAECLNYPYLAWAEAHTLGLDWPMSADPSRHPLTWERNASQADYAAAVRIGPDSAEARTCRPHCWHAAEWMLYLLDRPAHV